jgi:DNA-binding PadR family transcriptional regulator
VIAELRNQKDISRVGMRQWAVFPIHFKRISLEATSICLPPRIGWQEERTRMMHLSLLELQVLLTIISLRPNAYAGSILKEINKRTKRDFWHGTIYAALERLEKQGLVKRVQERAATPKRGGKRKFMFALTAPGRQTLTRSLRTIVPFLQPGEVLAPAQRLRRKA